MLGLFNRFFFMKSVVLLGLSCALFASDGVCSSCCSTEDCKGKKCDCEDHKCDEKKNNPSESESEGGALSDEGSVRGSSHGAEESKEGFTDDLLDEDDD
jgi:hypothetical protein